MRQGLVKRMRLSEQDLEEIRGLADQVEAFDGLRMKLNWEMLRERPGFQVNDFLYYADDQLVGFLGIYIIVPSESELSGMVHPVYRRRGIFSKMEQEALDLLRSRGTGTAIYICPRASETGAAFLRRRGLTCSFSEYLMERKEAGSGDPEPALAQEPDKPDVRLREAGIPRDIPLLAELIASGFGMPLQEAEEFAKGASGPSEITYVIESDGRDAGKLSVQLEGGTAFIFGFCVKPELRGKGVGRAALAGTISKLERERGFRHFQLEVEVKNEGALGLYESVGFRRINVLDYYKLDMA